MTLKEIKMPMVTEESRVGRPINMEREPVGPKNAASKGSVGDVALRDAITIVVIAWLIVFFLAFSLRRHNV
jgi:hypothetical protein